MSTYIRAYDILAHLFEIFLHLVILFILKKHEKHLGIILHIVLHRADPIIRICRCLKISCLGFDQFLIDTVHLPEIVTFLPCDPYVEDQCDKRQCREHEYYPDRFFYREHTGIIYIAGKEHGKYVEYQE